jgi:hypothetical protein
VVVVPKEEGESYMPDPRDAKRLHDRRVAAKSDQQPNANATALQAAAATRKNGSGTGVPVAGTGKRNHRRVDGPRHNHPLRHMANRG